MEKILISLVVPVITMLQQIPGLRNPEMPRFIANRLIGLTLGVDLRSYRDHE